MEYFEAKLKSNGDKASHYFRPSWIAKLSDRNLPIRTLPYVLFEHVLFNLTSLMGIQIYMKIL
jgi:hypothetical protein